MKLNSTHPIKNLIEINLFRAKLGPLKLPTWTRNLFLVRPFEPNFQNFVPEFWNRLKLIFNPSSNWSRTWLSIFKKFLFLENSAFMAATALPRDPSDFLKMQETVNLLTLLIMHAESTTDATFVPSKILIPNVTWLQHINSRLLKMKSLASDSSIAVSIMSNCHKWHFIPSATFNQKIKWIPREVASETSVNATSSWHMVFEMLNWTGTFFITQDGVDLIKITVLHTEMVDLQLTEQKKLAKRKCNVVVS